MCENKCNEQECCCTRDKILTCACELFANRGYKATTVQDICSGADANIASVNYYFRNKECLYASVWEHALQVSQELGGRIDDDLPPREWLERAIEQRVRAIFSDGPGGWLPKLIHNEHHDRSHMSKELKHKILGHFHMRVANKIGEYFGGTLSELQLLSTTAYVMGMMPGLLMLRHHKYRNQSLTEDDLQTLTTNAKAYVFGGLQALKANLTQ